MTNALATLQKGELELSELEKLILEESAVEQDAYDPIPTRIKISPGGINVFSTNDGETFKSLTGIIAISQKARAYWPEQGTGSPPLCSSPDGTHGYINGEVTDAQYRAAITAKNPHPVIKLMDSNKVIPEHFDCATCPLSQWGSAHQGGKESKAIACKSLRRLVVIKDGWAQPALFTLPPTSIKSFDGYASALAREKGAYWATRTKVTLEKQSSNNGEPYSIATFAVESPLSDKSELMAVIEIRRQFAELVRAMPIDGNEYEVVDTNGDAAVPVSDDDVDETTPPF